MVAEIDEILVRHRHEALVEDGQPSHAGIEDAHGPRVHSGHRKWTLAFVLVGRVRVFLALLVVALTCAGAAEYSRPAAAAGG